MIEIEARMPGEIQFLESFYETQTLAVEKLQKSSFQDKYPEETVFVLLRKLIGYCISRWEKLNLINSFNKEFYGLEKHRTGEFKSDPEKLLSKNHSAQSRSAKTPE